ncbi:MAG: uroporphyrinogen-III synthase [Thermoanaerobaculia bacterium]
MSRPLAGIRVVVTRPSGHAADRLAAAFEQRGARVERLPLLEIVSPPDPRPLARAASELPLYDWLAFTSAHGVRALLDACGGALPARLRLAAVGIATAEALREAGYAAHVVATTSRAEGLAEALVPRVGHGRVLLPLATDARPLLEHRLCDAGADVTAVPAYAKRLPAEAPREAHRLFASNPLGWVTFTSPSTCHHFIEAVGTLWPARREELLAASIGPVTSAALRKAGVEPACEAGEPHPEALAEAVVAQTI